MKTKKLWKYLENSFGKTDIKGQLSNISLTEKLLQSQIDKAEIEKNKNSKLYKTLGVVLGMGVCILLV